MAVHSTEKSDCYQMVGVWQRLGILEIQLRNTEIGGSLGYKYAPRPFTRLLGLGLMTNLRSGGAMLRAGTQSYNDRKKCNVEDQPVATQNLVVGITDTTGSPPATARSGWCHSCWWWRR